MAKSYNLMEFPLNFHWKAISMLFHIHYIKNDHVLWLCANARYVLCLSLSLFEPLGNNKPFCQNWQLITLFIPMRPYHKIWWCMIWILFTPFKKEIKHTTDFMCHSRQNTHIPQAHLWLKNGTFPFFNYSSVCTLQKMVLMWTSHRLLSPSLSLSLSFFFSLFAGNEAENLVNSYYFLLHFNVWIVHGVKERVIVCGVATQLREDDHKGEESDNADDENHEEPLLDSTRVSLLAAISGPENKPRYRWSWSCQLCSNTTFYFRAFL